MIMKKQGLEEEKRTWIREKAQLAREIAEQKEAMQTEIDSLHEVLNSARKQIQFLAEERQKLQDIVDNVAEAFEEFTDFDKEPDEYEFNEFKIKSEVSDDVNED